MKIDKNIKFQLGNLEFINYVGLSESDLKIILDFRNHSKVRKMMHSPNEISVKDHFEFVEKLKIDLDNFYWVIKKKDVIIGGISITKVDYERREIFSGIFLNPKFIGTGVGVEIEFESMKLIFDIFQIETIKAVVLEINNFSHSLLIKFNFKPIEIQPTYTVYQLNKNNWLQMPQTYKEFKYELLQSIRE
jgi:UDP-4-amino-4,6-dideoxy-N-acetyl-beta-L-altrosamine N-acetyltransferase